ncbi:MAG: CDP-archaeol synthase [Gammaproteobacteria bacterium]|nr:CDP-archaeol synthase [Gammaproteobacteria bacterium]
MTLVLQLLWLAVPVIVSGLVHLAVLKLDLLPGLRALPIDGGATFRGKRVFGANKTWRGAVITISTMSLTAWALAELHACCLHLPTLVPFAETNPLAWGILLGAGYIAGELPNSIVKRQIGIGPGRSGSGLVGRVFWVVDQLDSLAGMLLFTWPVWHPPPALVLLLVVIMLVAHPLGAWIMVLFGLKDRVG